MKNLFDELAKSMVRSVTGCRALKELAFGLALASLFAWPARAADLYADANTAANGDGTAARPYWRITEAVERARVLRQTAAIPPAERIVIHVAAGTYLGSKVSSVLARNPRYEVLPIILNVPNLTLNGATLLTTDAQGLPNDVQPGTETLLATEDHYGSQGKSLILLSRTTDGLAGDDVTVSGLRLEYLNDRYQVDSAIIVDRVSNFAIRQNFIHRAWAGIYSTRASGTITGNLITEGDWGIVAKGGSRAYPAQYHITGNRVSHHPHNGILIEASGVTPEIDVGANDLKLESLPLSEVRDDPPFSTDATVTGNDASDNGFSGLRLFIYSPPIKPAVPMLPVNPRVSVTASDNILNRNGAYGLVVDGNLASRSIKSPLIGAISAQLANNALEDNGRAPAFFTFTSYFVWCCGAALKDIKYIQDSTFQITDLDGELTGFDYDNPVIDPFDGMVLNNTLIVNGAAIAPGTKISSTGP